MNAHEIGLDLAVPGMVLAADLFDVHGSVLLPAGVALSVANLASLRRRGVAACRIVVPDAGTPGADAPGQEADDGEAEQARRRQRLARLFRGSASIGASAMLLQLLLAHRRGD